jgi:copper chaperone CopZ
VDQLAGTRYWRRWTPKKIEVNIKFEKGKVNINDMVEAINKSGYKVIKQ